MNFAPRDARFLLALTSPFAPLAGYQLGMNFYAFAVFFVAVPILDLAIGRRAEPCSGQELARLERSLLLRAILIAYAPMHLALIGWGAWIIGRGELSAWQALGLTLSVGLITGAQGITIAHELGHKRSRLERWLAKLLLVTVSYGHFTVEHNRGHHVRVATPEDPASARFGEGFWAFLPRTLWGSLRHAWELDRTEVLGSVAASALIAAALGLAFGPQAIAFFLGQSAMAVTLLEGVNYIEHYGLVRRRLPNGKYERMSERHAWDAYEWLTNCFLVHLQRHADHHLEPSRPYAALQPRELSPKLPTGYAGMLPLALLPPLWFAVMNRRVPNPPA
ncbi:MAG: alkane 1-monooxygenase [Betaproteobacteria bacterium]|nr:alkane 1-monooxygenase [Betaproteobacteria bacterium]